MFKGWQKGSKEYLKGIYVSTESNSFAMTLIGSFNLKNYNMFVKIRKCTFVETPGTENVIILWIKNRNNVYFIIIFSRLYVYIF